MAKKTQTATPTATLEPIHIPDEQIPSFEVVERRIKYGDAASLSGPSIELINQPEPMALYWGNSAREGRHFQLTKRKGWVPVKMSELANRLDVGGDIQETPDGIVARGEKGREVLYKMPKRLYQALEQRKADDNLKKSRSSSHLKQATQEQIHADADRAGLSQEQREKLLRGADQLGRTMMDLEMRETRVSEE